MFATRARRLGSVGCLSFACACSPSTEAPIAPRTPARAGAADPAPAAPRVPSPELLRHWPFADEAELVVYADTKGFRGTALGEGVVPAVLALADGSTSADGSRCLEALVQTSDEILFGANDELGAVGLIRLDAVRREATLAACRKPFAETKRPPIEGELETYQSGLQVVVVTPDCLIWSQNELGAKAALGARKKEGPLVRAELPVDRYLTYHFASPEDGVEARGGLLARAERFLLDVDVTLADERTATLVEQGVRASRGRFVGGDVPPDQAEAISRILEAVSVTRRGNRIQGRFELVEDAVAQARDIGIVSALVVHGARRYITNSKSAEARLGVDRIAKDLAAYVETERERNPKKKVRFSSLPAVPPTVPSGSKLQTAPGDWQAWSTIGFRMSEPQYYQYEVQAAPDGKSVKIVARGDLNGDGKHSEFSLSMRIEADGSLAIDPQLSARDPLE